MRERGREVRGDAGEIEAMGTQAGRVEVAGARAGARWPHALLPTSRRWKTVATRLGKSRSLCAYRASPWIDLLAHTVLDEITEITHISLLHR